MSAVSPAARAVKQANDGVGRWLVDLISGSGSSPAHIIVTGVLGVVPGVGQAMDVRDLVLGIIVVVRYPAGIGGWVDLAISLIGCVPAVGDALKVGFKLMKQGKSFGRVLEAVSPRLRGNVERYLRDINWSMLASQSKSLFNRAVEAFVDGLDSWVVKVVAGRHEVAQYIEELRAIQRRGPQMIDEAFAELRSMHSRMMGHELPRNTAAVTPPARRIAPASNEVARTERQRIEAARIERKLAAKRAAKEKTPRASPNSTSNSTKKKAEKKKQSWSSGVPAEHITDYYVKRKHGNFRKAKNNGMLTEEHSVGHNGLDHLWANGGVSRPFVVGETKSSIFDSFKLMAALPSDLQEAFSVLRAEEKANPTSTNGKPNIFENEKRDAHADRRVPVGGSDADDAEVRKGLNKPNESTGLRTQMSHLWIADRLALPGELLTVQGRRLPGLIRDWRDGDIDCPYSRWISLVTGRQLNKHRQSGGAQHEVQTILHLPDNILER